MLYAIKTDQDFSGLLIIFGNQASIDEQAISPEHMDYDIVSNLGVALDDTGEVCEDYIICSAKYNEDDIPTVKGIVERYGVTESKELADVGWG
jgi:hypothetical protein